MKNLTLMENIERIFKTKKYSIPLNPNYGLSYDWVDRAFTKELELKIVQEISEQINLFEPRLNIDSIEISKKESSLEISINTELRIVI